MFSMCMYACEFTREPQYYHSTRQGIVSTVRSKPGRLGWSSWEDGSCCDGKAEAPCSSNLPPHQPRPQLYFGDRILEHLPAETERMKRQKAGAKNLLSQALSQLLNVSF